MAKYKVLPMQMPKDRSTLDVKKGNTSFISSLLKDILFLEIKASMQISISNLYKILKINMIVSVNIMALNVLFLMPFLDPIKDSIFQKKFWKYRSKTLQTFSAYVWETLLKFVELTKQDLVSFSSS